MNKSTKNAIASAISQYTGHGKTRRDYFAIFDIIRGFGFRITDKITDEYHEYFRNNELTHEINCYIS